MPITYYTKKNQPFQISQSDYDLVKKFNWFVRGDGYVATNIKDDGIYHYKNSKRQKTKQKTVLLHRLIMGVSDKKIVVDHINGNTLDNTRENLRVTKHSGNSVNRTKLHSKNKSGATGVRWDEKRQTYVGSIQYKGERYYAPCSKDLNVVKTYIENLREKFLKEDIK